MTRLGWGQGWRVMAEHPLLMKIFIGSLLLGLVFLMLRRRTREHEAHEAFLQHCVAQGVAEDHCDDLLDRHHTACFGMSYAGGSRTTREHLDRARYVECVMLSPKTWLQERRRALEEQQRQRARDEGGL